MFQRPGRVSCGHTGGGVAAAQFIEKARQRSRKGRPELEGARHRAAPIAADAVRRQQVVVRLLLAPKRERRRDVPAPVPMPSRLRPVPASPPPAWRGHPSISDESARHAARSPGRGAPCAAAPRRNGDTTTVPIASMPPGILAVHSLRQPGHADVALPRRCRGAPCRPQ